MKKCNCCGYKNADWAIICKVCKASLPHEPDKEPIVEPVRVSKRKLKESE